MEKIKQFLESEKGKDVLIITIVILVGLGSFELGRLSKEGKNSGIKIEYTNGIENQEANIISTINPSQTISKNFFASSRGSKYYPVGCSAGKTIVQENRIYFATKEEATAAGYELSGSCK